MADNVIRPSIKFIQMGYVATIVLLLGAAVVHYKYLQPKQQPPWLPGVVALLLLWPVSRNIRSRFTKMTINGEKLYYESGALSKHTRIIQIPKIQDVRVQQTLGQRMFGVGDLSIETAGETSRLTFQNLDQPRAVAERLLELAKGEQGRAHLA
jgi:uncharacterized membrane protein YdbT with pleckstrin-like domain